MPTPTVYGFDCGFADFPGRFSVTVYLGGCNMNCPFCFNEQMRTDLGSIPVVEAAKYIRKVQAGFRSDNAFGVVLSGGEPSVSPYLYEVSEALEGIDLGLHTNGTKRIEPDCMQFKSVVLSLKPLSILPYGFEQYKYLLNLAMENYSYAEFKQLRVVNAPEYLDEYMRVLNVLKPQDFGFNVKWTRVLRPVQNLDQYTTEEVLTNEG